MTPLTNHDHILIQQAIDHIEQRFTLLKHKLATVLLTKSGKTITSVNLEGSFGCNDICAEQIALGTAANQGLIDQVICAVTVRKPKPGELNTQTRVVNPCGKCRELLIDYIPEAAVILRQPDNTLIKESIKKLLPNRYDR